MTSRAKINKPEDNSIYRVFFSTDSFPIIFRVNCGFVINLQYPVQWCSRGLVGPWRRQGTFFQGTVARSHFLVTRKF